MLFGMPGTRKPKPGARKSPARKTPARKTPATAAADASGFPVAFAALLKKKKVPVPKGLLEAPPEAYASQDPSFVDQLANLPNSQLKAFADKVAGYADRQKERGRVEWERSPLIAELRRRKLKEPPMPARPSGVSVSLAKPLAKWTDKELLRAAEAWSKASSKKNRS
jgi:hypothetical protein